MRERNQIEELHHHGIPGQRWGIRRYQNKDGSLTPAGRKRADKMKEEYTALTGKRLIRKPTKNSSPEQTKSVKDMSLNELKTKTDRLNAEKNYIDAVNSRKAQQTQITKGQAFIDKIKNEVFVPALTDVSKQLVKSFMVKTVNDAFKLDDELKIYTNNKKKN